VLKFISVCVRVTASPLAIDEFFFYLANKLTNLVAITATNAKCTISGGENAKNQGDI
jgi:hypothetical protein